jgi:hypothetical protein
MGRYRNDSYSWQRIACRLDPALRYQCQLGLGEFEAVGSFAWTQAAMNAVDETFQEAAMLGVTVFVASGDAGSDCRVGDKKAHVYYPASDPMTSPAAESVTFSLCLTFKLPPPFLGRLMTATRAEAYRTLPATLTDISARGDRRVSRYRRR